MSVYNKFKFESKCIHTYIMTVQCKHMYTQKKKTFQHRLRSFNTLSSQNIQHWAGRAQDSSKSQRGAVTTRDCYGA